MVRALPVHARLMGRQLPLKVLAYVLLRTSILIFPASQLLLREESLDGCTVLLPDRRSLVSSTTCSMSSKEHSLAQNRALTCMSLTRQGWMMPRSSRRAAYVLSTLGWS